MLEKMKAVLRLVIASMAVVLAIALPTQSLYAAEEEAADKIFMIVLDGSGSLKDTDMDNLNLTGSQMFSNALPVQGAKIGVVGFGKRAGSIYNFKSINGRISPIERDHMSHVELVSEPIEMTISSKADEIFESINEYCKTIVTGGITQTPIGSALLTALDVMLSQKEIADGADNAGIILITDGRYTTPEKESDDIEPGYIREAVKIAQEHRWPIYVVELDYNGDNDQYDYSIRFREMLGDITADVPTSVIQYGKKHVTLTRDINDLSLQSSNLLNYFSNVLRVSYPESIMENKPRNFENGKIIQEFSLPPLTSEMNILCIGQGIKSISLTNNETGETKTFNSKGYGENWRFNTETDKYMALKMVAPDPGTYIIEIVGSGNDKVFIQSFLNKDADMAIFASTAKGDEVVNGSAIFHDEGGNGSAVLDVKANLVYGGLKPKEDRSYYETYAAQLNVYHNGSAAADTYNLEASEDGYIAKIPLDGYGDYRFEAELTLKHKDVTEPMTFKTKESLAFTVRNEKFKLNGTNPTPYTLYVNENLQGVDLVNKYFSNPDGDAPIASLVVLSAEEIVDGPSIVENADGTFVLNAGKHETEEKYLLSVRDKETSLNEAESVELTLSIVNREPVYLGGLPTSLTFVEDFPFFKDGKLYASHYQGSENLKLGEYFSDPDGLPLKYVINGEELIVNLNIGEFEISKVDDDLTIIPKSSGNTTISISAKDSDNALSNEIYLSISTTRWIDKYIVAIRIVLVIIVLVILAICVLWILRTLVGVKVSITLNITDNIPERNISIVPLGDMVFLKGPYPDKQRYKGYPKSILFKTALGVLTNIRHDTVIPYLDKWTIIAPWFFMINRLKLKVVAPKDYKLQIDDEKTERDNDPIYRKKANVTFGYGSFGTKRHHEIRVFDNSENSDAEKMYVYIELERN
ncbi:MAG: VWA domain-containing protein [Clostridiales bacterium]|nr:VWA domain-containing protein [Clostridiales bacterium]